MPVIDYGHGLKIRIPDGASVLDASNIEELDHAQACKGDGRCTTCRVLIEEGSEHCPAAGPLELDALNAVGLRPPVRLACQLRPTGDVRVQILIPVHESPDREIRSVSEEEVAVIFADIRGFTSFAEQQLPFDVCSVLNRYFDIMGVIVERHGGQIIDYLGDGLMMLFRPTGTDDPGRRAVACTLAMRKAAVRFGSYVRNNFGTDLGIGIAVHKGRAVVGNLGYFRDRHLNAVGDVLNVVSRIEEFNKEYETDVLVSDTVANACGDMMELGRSFELTVRGRKQTITAHEVIGRATAERATEAEL